MSLARRRIDVTITLGNGEYGATPGDTLTLTGYRVQAAISVYGGEAMGTAQARIYGLPVDTLNRLTSIGPIAQGVRAGSVVTIAAGDEGEALSTVFRGTIYPGAWAEMQEAPNAALVVEGAAGMVAAVKPIAASSYVGPTQVSAIMADFAKEGGFAFENNGVQVTLNSPYFPGTTLSKIQACARAAGIYYSLTNDVLAIWPKDGYRQQDNTPVVSPANGLVGYPTYNEQGIGFRCLFNPRLIYGGLVQVQGSILTPANNTWRIVSCTHNLESQTPNGAWFTDVYASGDWGSNYG